MRGKVGYRDVVSERGKEIGEGNERMRGEVELILGRERKVGK